MSAVDTQLADALAAILRTYEVSSSESHLALYRKLGEAGWWDFFDLGLSDGGEIGVEEALLAGETLGRFVVTPDILATMGFLVPLLGRLADKGPMSGKLRERLDAGECLCVALPNVGEPLRGRRIDHNVRLFGPLERVVGKNPKCALVPIQLDDERAFAAVELDRPGVSQNSRESVVVGHQALSLSFCDVEITAANIATDANFEALRYASAVFSLLLDTYSVGIAAECLRRSVEYTSARCQFGHPVGAFQAVQHMAAEIHVRVETSRSSVLAAARAVASDNADAADLIAVSRLHCAASAQTAAEIAIQMHGGAGFTWEFGLHHLYRAAMFARHYLTNEDGLRQKLAASIRGRARSAIAEKEAA